MRSSSNGTPSATARRSFADAVSRSLVTSALVCRLTEVITLSPAATDLAINSSRETSVSPVIAIFIPCTRGAPSASRPGLPYAQGVLGTRGLYSCRGGQATSGSGTPRLAADTSDPRRMPASTRTSSPASCGRICRTP